jgi:hypothetical protein
VRAYGVLVVAAVKYLSRKTTTCGLTVCSEAADGVLLLTILWCRFAGMNSTTWPSTRTRSPTATSGTAELKTKTPSEVASSPSGAPCRNKPLPWTSVTTPSASARSPTTGEACGRALDRARGRQRRRSRRRHVLNAKPALRDKATT